MKILSKIMMLFLLIIYQSPLIADPTSHKPSFFGIFTALGDINYCNHAENAAEHDKVKNTWSCVFIKSFFPSMIDKPGHSLFSVLTMSISYFVYYIAMIFFIYFILKLSINAAFSGKLLSNTEDNSVFVRFLIGLFLLFPVNNYNSLVIHHVVYSVINISSAVSNQVMSQFKKTELIHNQMPDAGTNIGWDQSMFSWTLDFINSYQKTGTNFGFSTNKIRPSFSDLNNSAKDLSLAPGELYETFLAIFYSFIPIMSFGDLGGPANVNSNRKKSAAMQRGLGTFVDSLFSPTMFIFEMLFGLIGWLPVVIYLIAIPLVPMITFISIYIGWLYASLELMMLAPLIGLGLMWPFIGADSFLGKILPVMYLSLWIIFAPSILIISYPIIFVLIDLVSFLIYFIGDDVFNTITSALDTVKNANKPVSMFNVSASDIDLGKSAKMLFYTILLLTVVMKCFSFLKDIMFRFLMMIGDNFGVDISGMYSLRDHSMQVVKNLVQYLKVDTGRQNVSSEMDARKKK